MLTFFILNFCNVEPVAPVALDIPLSSIDIKSRGQRFKSGWTVA